MNSRLLHDGEVWYNTFENGMFMRFPFCLESRFIDWQRGERFTPPPLTTKIPTSVGRRNAKRAAQIAEIAHDDRITNSCLTVKSKLIDDVMDLYNVSRTNARRLISMARKLNRQVV